MSSRCFPGPAVFNQTDGTFIEYHDDQNSRAPVLIPGLDLMNHIPGSRVAWHWDSKGSTIKTDKDLGGGEEVPNNYGPKSNEECTLFLIL